MNYQRVIKFQYYVIKYSKCVDGKWDIPKPFDFVKWLIEIKKGGLIQKSIEFNDTLARVDKITYDDKNKLWCIRFMKLRDTNIPSKVKENEEAETIPLEDDEYIGEDLNLIYEKKSGIAMIQSNRFSLGISKLSEFIQNTNADKDIRVVIQPISEIFEKKRIRKQEIKSIEIGFANLIDLNHTISEDYTLSSIIKPMKNWGGIVGRIVVSLGRTKEKSLNRTEIEQIINEIEQNKHLLSVARLKCKDDDNARTEVIDLFDNIAHDFISFTLETRTNLQFEYAINSMIDRFVKSRKRLYKLISIIEE